MDRVPRAGELYKDAANRTYQVAAVAVHANTGEHMVVYQALYGDFGVYTMPLKQFLAEIDKEKYLQAVQQHLFEKINKAVPAGVLTDESNMPGSMDDPAGESKPRSWAEQQDADQQSALSKDLEGGYEKNQAAGNPEIQQGGTFVQALKARTGNSSKPAASTVQSRPRTQSPAESRRVLRHHETDSFREGDHDYEKRRRQLEEREQRREMFRRTQNSESASDELRANPCLIKFLEAETYEDKFRVLREIQDDITDRLIDDIAVVLDVVIPEGDLHDRFRQLQSIILTRQKYEINRFR